MRCKLADICSKIGSGATPRGGKEAYCEKGISLVRSQNVLDFSFSHDGLAFINNEQAAKLSNVEVFDGDVLLNITGDSVARACIMDSAFLPARVNQHVAIVRGKKSHVLNRYLLYFLQWQKGYLLQLASAGATRNALTKGMLEQLEIDLPSLDEQKRIVAILGALDDKIELNNKINENLWKQMFAFYKNVVSLPYARETSLSTLCDLQEGYVNPAQTCPEYFDGEIKWLRAVDINESFIIETSRTLTKTGFESAKKSAVLFNPNTIAISKSGTIGRLGIIADYMCGNRAVINIVPRDKNMLAFIYCFLKNKQREFLNMAVGSVQKNLYISLLEPLAVILPNDEILSNFNVVGISLLNAIHNNCVENVKLEHLRDTLLPRLMSNKSDVFDS